jgi:hypothetical protein
MKRSIIYRSLVIFQGVTIFKAMQYKPLTLESYDYPDFGDAIGWLSAAAPILIVPGWFIGYYCWKGGANVSCKTFIGC